METGNKPFYKKWWGVILVILFFPFLLPYVLWDLDKWHLYDWRNKKTFTKNEMILPYVGLCVILIIIFSSIGSSTPKQTEIAKVEEKVLTPEQIAENKRMELVEELKKKDIISRVFVEQQIDSVLKSPKSAEYSLQTRVEVGTEDTATRTQKVIVFGYVDSTNSFNAMLRNDIYAELDYSNGKGGELIKLKLGDKVLR